MEKVKYYKKIKKDGKIWFSESLGELVDVPLPNGKTHHLVCEFIRGDGWRITDRETGLLTQNEYIPNKKVLTEYIKGKDFLTALSRITNTEYYEKQKDELKQFFGKIKPVRRVSENETKRRKASRVKPKI